MWNDLTVTVPCHRCGKPQVRHYSRAKQQATCFGCRALRQKEWSKGRTARDITPRTDAMVVHLGDDEDDLCRTGSM